MKEFVPQRTAAYISQYDNHIGEMTVRETLAFSARCQGVGSRYGKSIPRIWFFYCNMENNGFWKESKGIRMKFIKYFLIIGL